MLHRTAVSLSNNLLLILLLAATGITEAQPIYPNRAVRLIVPYTVGTSMDLAARTVGQKAAELWGVPVVVENRPGAGGNIGSDAVAKSTPDGYTLLLNGTTLVINPHVIPHMPFDLQKDFSPVIQLVKGTLALTVSGSLPARTLAEFVAHIKARPGQLNYASPGNGTPHHVGMELLKTSLGLEIVHVPYKGTGTAITDLIGGRVTAMLLPTPVALPQEKDGQLRILAAGTTRRSPLTAHVPTFEEQGQRGLDPDYWIGIFAPAGLPDDILRKLNTDFAATIAHPATREILEKQGFITTGTTSEAMTRIIVDDLVRWGNVVRTAKIKAD